MKNNIHILNMDVILNNDVLILIFNKVDINTKKNIRYINKMFDELIINYCVNDYYMNSEFINNIYNKKIQKILHYANKCIYIPNSVTHIIFGY